MNFVAGSFKVCASRGRSKEARNTTANPSEAQNRYTFWPMNPVSV